MKHFRLSLLLATFLATPLLAQSIVPVPRPDGQQISVVEQEIVSTRRLTRVEREVFVSQIQACWATANLAEAEKNVAMTLGFQLDEDAVPIPNSFDLIQTTARNQTIADLAFLAAREAVIQCGNVGYALPPEARLYWTRVELNLNAQMHGEAGE